MRKSILGLAVLSASVFTAPALSAQDAMESDTAVEATSEDEALAAVMGMMSGLFTSEPLTADEEARLPSAMRIAAAMMPDGFYGEMMGDMMDSTMRPIFDAMINPEMIVMSRSGASPDALESLDETQLEEAARILDPAYDQRGDAIMNSVSGAMREIGTAMEAPMREGYSRAFAKRFDGAQLADIETFFATPTGGAFASETMALFADPEVMSSVMGTMPAMMGTLGDMESTMDEAMASLPVEPEFYDLTSAQRERLTSLLGVDAATLEAAMASAEELPADQ